MKRSSEAPTNAIAEIAVNAPLDRLFHYCVPEHLQATLARGHRVLVPFGHRATTGVCVGFPREPQVQKLKPIREILQPDYQFDAHLLELTRWIASYYFASWGEVLESALPPGIRATRRKKPQPFIAATLPASALLEEAERLRKRARSQSRILETLAKAADPTSPRLLKELAREARTTRDTVRRLEERGFVVVTDEIPDDSPASGASPEEIRLLLTESRLPESAVQLVREQQQALDVIIGAIETSKETAPAPVLVHGVTGSGKTEVYIRALHHVLQRGKRAIVLVPEISLTPQTVNTFKVGLPGVPVAVLHSMLTARQRADQWRGIQSGRIGVVIGARSAVFSPVPDLGLIVVDEEHDTSYKQESSPRYHGRDVAIMRAHLLKVPVVLGSATPSLESYGNALAGKYTLTSLRHRVTPHDLPNVAVVPLGGDYYRADGSGLLSGPLDFQIKQCLKRKEQAIIFLNRRGFSTFLHCVHCGFVLKCEYCDIALTYHQRDRQTRCHYCDSRYETPKACPECQFPNLKRSGAGTEKVAELLTTRYSSARVLRMDRDTVKNHESLRTVLDSFVQGEADILVGTQMLAKGHDFPGVSLVGILTADTGLHFPDFRASERTFQLITQVSGRAGRGERAGRVIVQTFFPDHFAIQTAVKNDYRGFYNNEIENRRLLRYPPYGRLARILVQAAKPEPARKNAEEIVARLRVSLPTITSGSDEHIDILGPSEAPITRIQERHRFQILVKATTVHALHSLLRSTSLRSGRGSSDVFVDVDPQSLL